MARNEHDAHAMLAGTYHLPREDETTAALVALQAEREIAQQVLRERQARRFAFE